MYFRKYPRVRHAEAESAWTKSSLLADVHWLRQQLLQHQVLREEVKWPSPEELELQRTQLVEAGLLTAGFEDATFMCDGTKDLGRRSAHYNRKHEPDYSQKGNGKSHLLVSRLCMCKQWTRFNRVAHALVACEQVTHM